MALNEANTRAVVWDRISRKTRVLVWMVGANILLNLIMLWQVSSLLVAVGT